MSDWLRLGPAATPAMLTTWSDAAVLAHALAFEAALARAQADEGLIDADTATRIEQACAAARFDPETLAAAAAHAGTLAIPLVAQLRATLDPAAAAALHRGATSQDLADTVAMQQVNAAAALLAGDAARTVAALNPLAIRWAGAPAVGRTLLQDAVPIGWGLRVAHWAAGVQEAATALGDAVATQARVQFGGAAGTRAGLGGRGAAVAERVAASLGLKAAAPWHARRIGVAAIGAGVGLLIGALGKMARDVALLAQNTIAEAREPATPGRGVSSAMPHKRNPTGCQVALSAATRAPGLVASLFAGLPQEAERGLGGWQAEAPVLADLFLLASGAAAAMATVAEGLEIDEAAIARNLDRADIGRDIGESVAIVADLLGSRD